jgi:hypothetical protein
MIGIFVDDDLIGIPEPVVGETKIIGCNAEIKTTEPETRWAAAGEMEYVAASEAAGKTTMLPRMIEVVVSIVAAGVVADPLIVGVDVRCVGVSTPIAEVGMFGSWTRITSYWGRTVSRYVTAANSMGGMLCRRGSSSGQNRDKQRKRKSEKYGESFHSGLRQGVPFVRSSAKDEKFPGAPPQARNSGGKNEDRNAYETRRAPMVFSM